MKLQTLKKKKKAFTLLELLVVLAILAILIAIAIPVYKGQKEKAAITAHNANVRVLETALESYKQDHGKLPGDIKELATGGYIKSVPNIPAGAVKDTDAKEYGIDKDGNIKPGEVDKDDKLNSVSTETTTTEGK